MSECQILTSRLLRTNVFADAEPVARNQCGTLQSNQWEIIRYRKRHHKLNLIDSIAGRNQQVCLYVARQHRGSNRIRGEESC